MDKVHTGKFKLRQLCSIFFLTLIFQTALWSFFVFADSPGDFDSTFNGTGIVTTSIATIDQGVDIALQPDSKIIVAGSSYDNSTNSDFAVIRYNDDGSLDTTFGGGVITTSISGESDGAYSVTLQPDGKIVVAGVSDRFNNGDFAIARYTSTGNLDNTFNGTGIVTTSISSGSDVASDVAIQPDDKKIIVAGWGGAVNFIALARYTITGSLDTTFNGSGIVTTTCGTSCAGQALALQTDGKIIVAGIISNGGVFNADFVVVRYDRDGNLDNTFGQTGIVTTTVNTGLFGHTMDIDIQPDGKIVVVGSMDTGVFNYGLGIVRYNSDGSLDTTFNGTGIVTTVLSGDDDANAVAIQPNGKIVVAGTRDYGITSDLALARYNNNGSLDTSFNGSGILVTSINNYVYGTSIVLQPDGKIVVTGGTSQSNNTEDIVVVRYIGDYLTLFLPVIVKR